MNGSEMKDGSAILLFPEDVCATIKKLDDDLSVALVKRLQCVNAMYIDK